jgi:hypothetical protein
MLINISIILYQFNIGIIFNRFAIMLDFLDLDPKLWNENVNQYKKGK